MKQFKLFINNEWVDAKDGKTFISYDPATGEPIAELACASKEDVDKAAAAAKFFSTLRIWAKGSIRISVLPTSPMRWFLI